jgi:hypothetical protein
MKRRIGAEPQEFAAVRALGASARFIGFRIKPTLFSFSLS